MYYTNNNAGTDINFFGIIVGVITFVVVFVVSALLSICD